MAGLTPDCNVSDRRLAAAALKVGAGREGAPA